MRGRRRILSAVAATALSAIALSACGSSNSDSSSASVSSVDPATKVPASAVLYVSVTVQPQGSTATSLKKVVNELGGAGAEQRLVRELERSLATGKNGVNFKKDLQPWLGQKIGIAFTAWPSSFSNSSELMQDLVIVAPTDNPAAAKKALPQVVKGSGEATKSEVDGKYVLIGGAKALTAAAAVTSGDSLAAKSTYKHQSALVPSSSVTSVYVDYHALIPELESVASNDPTERSAIASEFKDYGPDANGMLALSVSDKSIQIDDTESGVKKPPGTKSGDIGKLPGTSWLALSGSVPASETSELKAAFARGYALGSSATSGTAGQLSSKLSNAIVNALSGTTSVSLSGDSLLDLQALIDLAPNNPANAAQLVSALHTNLKGLGAAGSSKSFSIPLSSIGTIRVTNSDGHAAITYGYPSVAAAISPTSTLAANSTFQTAEATLPSGSHASLYLNFRPIDALGQLDTSSSDRRVWRAIGKLSYLIIGGSTTHTRMVLGLSGS